MTDPNAPTTPVLDAGTDAGTGAGVPLQRDGHRPAGARSPGRSGAGTAGSSTARRTWREWVGTLFPQDPARPGLAHWWYWPAIAVVVGAWVSLARVPYGPGVLNTIWAEDGSNFLSDALNRNQLKSILRPINGYFAMVPRALALPASWVPLEWSAAVLTAEAALVTGLMAVAVYLASRQHLRNPLARLIASAPILASPVGENIAAAASNNVATLQFAGVYMAMWMVLWVPRRRGAQIAAVLAVLAVSVSTFLAVVLLPLALLRLYARRDRASVAIVASMLIALAANVTILVIGLTHRPYMLPSRWDPIWALRTTAEWALPHSVFGYGITGKGHQTAEPSWLIPTSWAIVAAFILIAAFHLSRPQWKLAALMGVTAVAFVSGTAMQYGGTELRYVIAPELMLFAALAALTLPRPDRPRWIAWAPLVTLAVGVSLVFAFSYHTLGPRTRELAPWDQSVANARAACRADPNAGWVYITTGDGSARTVAKDKTPHNMWGFPVLVPCDRLR